MIKFGSLFSGIGGFELGFKQALGNRLKIEWACEIDKYARQIYEKHFKGIKIHEDAREIIPKQLKDVDIITAGFPCQSFSTAGKRKGFVDTRGTLYFEILRIAKVKRPKYLLLENVKGLLSNDRGRTFETILWTLAELGYDVEWQVLNSKNFGVPQNRERVFIVGYIRGEGQPKIFPIQESNIYPTENKKGTIAPSLQSSYYKGVSRERGMIYVGGIIDKDKNKMWLNDGKELSRNFPQGQRVYSTNGISAQLNAHAGGLGAKTGLYEMVEGEIRRLTPLECERLQGFPDNYTEGVSDTQRYKCLGNAVTVNVIEFLAKRLFNDKPNGVV